jgi:hypothetical protein
MAVTAITGYSCRLVTVGNQNCGNTSHGPFKIITTTATNSRLQLPKQWRIHPVFHNSLLTPYNETPEHGPNYTQPPPEIIEGEDEHYEVETILNARPTPNRRGIQYLVKWKGYPDSENT